MIATIARRAAAAGWEVLVVTGDRDTFQLVGGPIKVVYTRRGISDTVMADAALGRGALRGHPGAVPRLRRPARRHLGQPARRARGGGEDGGAPGRRSTGAWRALYDHLEDQTPRLRESLEAAREQVFLNRHLTYLVEDVPVDADPEELRLQPWDPARVRPVFDALAFRSLWQRLQEVGGGGEPDAAEVLAWRWAPGRAADAMAAAEGGMLALEPVWDDGDLIGVVVAGPPKGRPSSPPNAWGRWRRRWPTRRAPKALHDAKPLTRALLEADLRPGAGSPSTPPWPGTSINPTERAPDLSDLAWTGARARDRPEAAAAAQERAQGTFDFDAAGPDLERAGAAGHWRSPAWSSRSPNSSRPGAASSLYRAGGAAPGAGAGPDGGGGHPGRPGVPGGAGGAACATGWPPWSGRSTRRPASRSTSTPPCSCGRCSSSGWRCRC